MLPSPRSSMTSTSFGRRHHQYPRGYGPTQRKQVNLSTFWDLRSGKSTPKLITPRFQNPKLDYRSQQRLWPNFFLLSSNPSTKTSRLDHNLLTSSCQNKIHKAQVLDTYVLLHFINMEQTGGASSSSITKLKGKDNYPLGAPRWRPSSTSSC